MSPSLNTTSERDPRPHAWRDWYRFARDQLGLGHDERVEYANLRFVEEENRESLRRRSDEKPAPHGD